MTTMEQLVKVIAWNICFVEGSHPDAIKHQFPETYYWEDYIPHAQAVLKHISPMLVDAIVYSSRIAQLSDHPVALAEIKRWSKDLCAKLECFVVKGGVE
jgi:hypothetical protein